MIKLDRREFIKKSGLTSVGFVVSLQLPLSNRKALAMNKAFDHHYFAIGTELNNFTFVFDKAEMGQGVITGQATLFCEELDLDPAKLNMVPASVDAIYGTMGGHQITGGSTSTPDRWQVLRQAGADIRQGLLIAAANKWNVKLSHLKTENGFILTKNDDKKISYNELSREIQLEGLSGTTLKKRSEFKYIGKKIKKVDAIEKTMGTASFGIDYTIPDMLNAIVIRPPAFGAKVESFDKSKALKIPGVEHVIEISSGVAVIGQKYWQVEKARGLVAVKWSESENARLSSRSIFADYDKKLKASRGKKSLAIGDIDKVIAETKDSLSVVAEYQLPYLAHAAMEPMNAIADVKKNKVDIWTGTQVPTAVLNKAAEFLGLSRDKVKVHNMKYLGGGFGRRSTTDYPMEAVELSAKIKKPIKVIWSREDDMRFSPMRPINKHLLKAIIKNEKPIAWEHRLACESIMQDFLPETIPQMLPGWLPSFIKEGLASTVGGAIDMLNFHMVTGEGAHIEYDIPNQYVGIHSSDVPVPIHFWRSVGHSYNGFVKESFIDELAVAAKKDPYEFRKKLLNKTPRLLKTLNTVAKLSGWGNSLEKNRFRGIACHYSFNSYVSQVAEVEIVDRQIFVKKVYCAVDCGVAINPDIVIDQMKSGIIYGLSAALYGKIDIDNGAVTQTNFHDYPVLRMSDAPSIEVEIIDSSESPTGVGEPGLPPIAAAVANAIFVATGQRIRTLPLSIS